MNKLIKSLLFSCLVFSVFESSLVAQTYSNSQQNNVALDLDPAELYNQSEISSSLVFMQASAEEKRNLLEDHFRQKKSALLNARLWSKGKWVLGHVLGQIGFFYLIWKFNPTTTSTHWLINGPLGMGSMGMLMHSLNEFSQSANQAQFDPLEEYEIAYVRKKPWFSESMQRSIEENFTAARRSSSIDRHLSFARIAVNMPTEVVQTKEVSKGAFEAKFAEQNNPKTFLGIQQWMHSYLRRQDNPQFPLNAAYFYGPSRTGKTKAAEWIAEFLGVPFEKINLGGQTVQDLFGTGKNSANPSPGLLVNALVNAKRNGKNGRNLIILFDELDRLITDGSSKEWLVRFLTLLDPNTKSFYSEYLDSDVDISSIGFIVAGNSELTGEEYKPFKNRLHEVPFDGYKKSYKERVIWNDWIPNLLKKQSTNCVLIKEDFKEEDISDMLQEDNDPGFHSIEWRLGQYFLAKDQKKCGWGNRTNSRF